MSTAVRRLAKDGVAVVKTGLAREATESWRQRSLGVLDHFRTLAVAKQLERTGEAGLGLGKEHGYRELVQKDRGRYDMNMDHHLVVDTGGGGGEPSAIPASRSAAAECRSTTAEGRSTAAEGTPTRRTSGLKNSFPEEERSTGGGGLASTTDLSDAGASLMASIRSVLEPAIAPVLERSLGGEYVMNGQGLVISEPGTEAQGWHADVSPIYGAQELWELNIPTGVLLPAYFFTVFMPLYDSTHPGIGPTELALGSHLLTGELKRKTVAEQYPAGDVVDRIVGASPGGVATMGSPGCECNAGDIFIMDGRLLHRGLANLSEQARPLVYMSFCRPWYHEWPRSQNEGRSLF